MLNPLLCFSFVSSNQVFMVTVFYQEFLCGEKCLDQLIQRLLQSADEEAITEFLDENLKLVK